MILELGMIESVLAPSNVLPAPRTASHGGIVEFGRCRVEDDRHAAHRASMTIIDVARVIAPSVARTVDVPTSSAVWRTSTPVALPMAPLS